MTPPPLSPEAHERKLTELTALTEWLDTKFTLPGTSIRFGLDALLGILPGIGDTIATGLSLYIVHQAHQLGTPLFTKIRMCWNIFIDWLIGLIPLIGDIFDIGFKANSKNLHLLKSHLEKHPPLSSLKDITPPSP